MEKAGPGPLSPELCNLISEVDAAYRVWNKLR